MRRYRRNADDRLRRLERSAAGGDPEASIALDRELWRTGEAIPYYARALLADFIEDLQTRRGHMLDHHNAERVLAGIEAREPYGGIGSTRLVASPGGSGGHGAGIMIPGPFGRRQGLMLSMSVQNYKSKWSTTGRTRIQDVARIEKDGGVAPSSTSIQLCVALVKPSDPFGAINPLYFFYRSRDAHTLTLEERVARRLPSRMECVNLLARDLDTPENALTYIGAALAEAFRLLNSRLGHVEQIISSTTHSITRLSGPPVTPEKVHAEIQRFPHGSERVNEFLFAIPGPVVGEGAPGAPRPVRAWNASGAGILEAALVSLAEWLRTNYRAVIQDLRKEPFPSDSAWLARGYMDVTSRRARNTGNPLGFEVDMDMLAGAWENRGDDWIGNRFSPGGLWKISMINTPSTVQDLYRPAITWIKSVFPEAQIQVAVNRGPGYTTPEYRDL